MSDSTTDVIPDGFEPLPTGLGFTDNLTLYRKVEDAQVRFGLLVGPQHSNTMKICHGGALMTLADIAAASSINIARGFMAGAPTTNLAMDFISAAKLGQWIEARPEGVELKRMFGFARGVIVNSRGVVARYNGSFYFPDHPGMSQDGVVRHGAMAGVFDGEAPV